MRLLGNAAMALTWAALVLAVVHTYLQEHHHGR